MNLLNPSFFIALRYWRAKSGDRFGRLVSSLASLGIVLGVMALIIVLSVMNAFEVNQKRNVLSHLPHAIVSPIEEKWSLDQTLSLPAGVEKAVPINRTNIVIQSQKGINAGQLIGVIDKESDPRLKHMIDVPHLLPEGEYRVLISQALASQLRLNIGDKIRLMITENSQYTPFGRVPVQRLFTISDIYLSSQNGEENTLFANIADVGRLLRMDSKEVQGVRLFLSDPFQITELVKTFPIEQWQINDWREQKGEFFQAVRMEKNMMGLLISLIIIVAISNIVTSLSLMVVDKQGEIAILQTQGLTKGSIMQIFIIQGAFVGIMGALLGGGLGTLVSYYFVELTSWLNPYGVPLFAMVDYQQVILIVSFSIILSLFCTLYPAFRAAKIEPAEALRYE